MDASRWDIWKSVILNRGVLLGFRRCVELHNCCCCLMHAAYADGVLTISYISNIRSSH